MSGIILSFRDVLVNKSDKMSCPHVSYIVVRRDKMNK